ncbi:MAG: hypothetical protein E6R14_10435 [Thermomicrobiales bacterium]|nr:MAG: hypothetical protein E6R14_10435 [Thermomicrobiales bacterium]
MSEAVTPISISFPSDVSARPRLRLTLAPIRLRISAADQEEWLTGTFTDPTGQMPLAVQTDGANVRITSSKNVTAFRKFKAPVLELKVSTRRPFSLSMDLGASDQTQVDLGGIPITDTDIKIGAGQAKFDFSLPNPHEMDSFTFRGGAAELSLVGLGNSGARRIDLDGGAASMTVDFGGRLMRDLDAGIRTGMASTEVIVPKTTSARIRTKTALAGVNVGDGFTVKDGAYSTLAFLGGHQPVLTIDLQSALGSVALKMDESIALPA